MKAQLSFFHDNGKFEATHEIGIPGGAVTFRYVTLCENQMDNIGQSIPIPRPKKKVKKWHWVVGEKGCGGVLANAFHRTEERIKADYPGVGWYHRIDETMIEVDE